MTLSHQALQDVGGGLSPAIHDPATVSLNGGRYQAQE
jgi:hypothetical protein